MKKILLHIICVYLFMATVSAQPVSVFHLNKLSANDTLLSGWKMFAGDDPLFSNPDFDDSKWQPIDPGKDIEQYQQLHNAGIIWLRLHVSVDTSLANQKLAAHIVQYTASEVYLNGERIQQYGVISKDPKKVLALLPSPHPFHVNFKNVADNIFAVRIAYEPHLPYISYLNGLLPVFNLYINRQEAAVKNYESGEHQVQMYIIIYGISSGTLMIIGFIYLIYFLFDRSKKVHLYYSLCTLALCLNAFPIEIWGAGRYGFIARALWVFYFEGVALTLGMLLMVLTIYSLFNYTHRTFFKLLFVGGIVVSVGLYTNGTLGNLFANIVFPVICLLEGAYVCVWAIKRNKKDAGIILAGVLLYILATLSTNFIDTDSIAAQLLFYVAQMFFPIVMSFYLGIQSSITNKKLLTSLEEVQLLSAKSLVQEKEKQQILSNQNELLEKQVDERTSELKLSLEELKSTQQQLIQSEKMASLGELTAGIAHEIQNPLNFVNNFSEVNSELIDEATQEIDKGNITEVKNILNDIKDNEEKINHHGKRADAIVKGMLQHSQSSKGQKEQTDINALCDEYLRLSYHGMRAKDKDFNAPIKTDFDNSIDKINIVPQDIGRVLLNLYNNAFYALAEKARQQTNGYEPVISVSTQKITNKVEIVVSDNGNGIPQKIVDKIFQPFFTTKPTGQGTGLGLSLSYDIIKAHGGEIAVNTKEDEGSEFVIQLPVV